ncbi:hypothetical protein BVC80_1775g6 [Macleaya cordata]|uniref:Uncharacterized protein n=1 Tax=Macleaya cordata TaxID=56857 RepID=A0A200QP02_MACCD|nr:hypothetical protein BVC80_1775g6 [Macleaya cordata]
MERRNSRENTDDDLAVVRAAAWAWYQHGSGSDGGKSIREFDLTRNERPIKPSRFKLETTRSNVDEIPDNESESSSLVLSPAQTDNSLLDAYETERILRELDCLIESSNDTVRRESHIGDRDCRRNIALHGISADVGEKKPRRKSIGSWLRYAAVCSSREDVVEPRWSGRRSGPHRRMHGPSSDPGSAHAKRK